MTTSTPKVVQWTTRFFTNSGLKASAQFIDQRSVGNNLTGDFETGSLGAGLAWGYKGFILRVAYTQTNKGAKIASPWGGTPSYNSMMLEDFNRANEKSMKFGMSWSGKKWGIDNWSGTMRIVSGWDAIDPATGQKLPNVHELNMTMDYKLDVEKKNPVWIRLRAAYADFEDDTERWNVRFIVNYPIKII